MRLTGKKDWMWMILQEEAFVGLKTRVGEEVVLVIPADKGLYRVKQMHRTLQWGKYSLNNKKMGSGDWWPLFLNR